MRHDVDLLPENAFAISDIEHRYGIRSTYYFRIVPASYNAEVIERIAALGHEIGYHYEDLCICNGDHHLAIKHFEESLEKLRIHYPIRTICMHGSPRSKYDPKDVWSAYNYRAYGIIAEAYRDVDFSKIGYLTDTGRCWNGAKYSIRDKVDTPYTLECKTTDDVIAWIERYKLPQQLMITTHPQRWNDKSLPWLKEFVLQNIKNQVKKQINKRKQ